MENSEIKSLVCDIEHVDLEYGGVRFEHDEAVIEIRPDYIAVKSVYDDNVSWEFLHNPTIEDAKKTISDPWWFT